MVSSEDKHVRLCYEDTEFILRQTPGSLGRWGEWTFDTGSIAPDRSPPRIYAGTVVYERLVRPLRLSCNPSRVMFVTGEPESIRAYHPEFLAQFAVILTSREDLQHSGVIRSQTAIPWWAGVRCKYPHKKNVRLGYDDFTNPRDARPAKSKLMSIVCSTKELTDGHRKRLALLERLRTHFGGHLDVFGHGFREIEDKWDAIAPYHYHIAIENSSYPHYWTEKIADAYLGGAFPLYWGCPNLESYFPVGSFAWIDRNDPARAIGAIESALEGASATTAHPHVSEARRRLLHEYNLFPVVCRIFDRLPHADARQLTIHPEADFTASTLRALGRKTKVWLTGAATAKRTPH